MENFFKKFLDESSLHFDPEKFAAENAEIASPEKIGGKLISKIVIGFVILVSLTIAAPGFAGEKFDFSDDCKNEFSISNYNSKYDYSKYQNLIDSIFAENICPAQINLEIFEKNGVQKIFFTIEISRYNFEKSFSATAKNFEKKLKKIEKTLPQPKITLDDSWGNSGKTEYNFDKSNSPNFKNWIFDPDL